MADQNIPSTPQAFAFGGRTLSGYMLGFTTKNQRRHVVHEYLKRRGAKVEDMGVGPQRVDVRLVFAGDDCAQQYAEFSKAVQAQPFGLLVHPVAGQFQAFCGGPDDSVDFKQAIDEIQVRCSFVESELDREAPEIPNVAQAAQEVTTQQSAFKTAVAKFMLGIARASATVNSALTAVDDAVATLDVVTAPVDFARETIAGVLAAKSNVVGKVNGIATRANLLADDIENFLAETSDIFGGQEALLVSADAVATRLGALVSDAEVLEAEMIAAQNTPAEAAEAVAASLEMVAACYVLSDAIDQALPPTVNYVVPELMDLVTLVMRRYPGIKRPFERVEAIRSMNRIPNPAAIPAGTALRIPSE